VWRSWRPPELLRIVTNSEVGRRSHCTTLLDLQPAPPRCGDPAGTGNAIRVPEHLDKAELADWPPGGNAVYQLAAWQWAHASLFVTNKSSIAQ
jgi:hypothetical protein